MKTFTCKPRPGWRAGNWPKQQGHGTRDFNMTRRRIFCRVLLASEGTRFVPETGIFYRVTSSNRVSYIGASDKKKDALFLSMKLHIQYLRSLEESERVRKACLTYMQNWYHNFYPERPDIAAELQALAAQFQGQPGGAPFALEIRVDEAGLWMESRKMGSSALPEFKVSCIRRWDKAMHIREKAKQPVAVMSLP